MKSKIQAICPSSYYQPATGFMVTDALGNSCTMEPYIMDPFA